MKVLTVNCGSSSVKADVIESSTGDRLWSMHATRLGNPGCQVVINQKAPQYFPNMNHADVLSQTLSGVSTSFEAIGHRVVHGGELFTQSIALTVEAIDAIDRLSVLAPLHNPVNLAGIRATHSLFPDVAQVAVFDTAFHATMPKRSKTYAIPREMAQKHGIRRFGFHGPSHQFVAARAASFLEVELRDLRLITCHLGNGASVCAVEYGRSVDVSMGMTPLEGLVMGTRSGDIDPGALLTMMREEGLSAEQMDQLLNRSSGLLGLAGVSDFRDIERLAAEGDEGARLAIGVFAHRLRKYIGAYAAVMGGVDAIVFTGGIGENSALLRHRACQRLSFLGAILDEDKNRDASIDPLHPVYEISTRRSRTQLLCVATDEAFAIAQQTASVLGESQPIFDNAIPIAISARHVHLNRKAIDILFGVNHQLQVHKNISQPGQYACKEKVDLVGPKRTIKGVRLIGPPRPKVQIEISRTDEFVLGIDAPVRDSGDVANSPGITLVGPAGRLTIEEGVICARRHIHMRPEDAQRFKVSDKDVVDVRIDSDGRDLTFGDVLVRVSSRYALEMHIDTDEANAAEIGPGFKGVLVGVNATAGIVKRRV